MAYLTGIAVAAQEAADTLRKIPIDGRSRPLSGAHRAAVQSTPKTETNAKSQLEIFDHPGMRGQLEDHERHTLVWLEAEQVVDKRGVARSNPVAVFGSAKMNPKRIRAAMRTAPRSRCASQARLDRRAIT